MLGDLFPIGGLIAGLITVGAGIVILVWPRIIAYIVGIYLTSWLVYRTSCLTMT